jgi:mannose-1-phosphate guanylyltransferase
LGFYEEQVLRDLVYKAAVKFGIDLTYLKEPADLGTGGGLFHFANTLFKDDPSHLILMHGDIASSFPLHHMMEFHKLKNPNGLTLMGTHVGTQDSHRFGCIVSEESGKVIHYAEKPNTDVSNLINAGVYIVHPNIVRRFPEIKSKKQVNITMDVPSYEFEDTNRIRLERDILTSLAGENNMYVYVLNKENDFWRQCKSAASAIQCSQDYYNFYKQHHPELLARNAKCEIVGEVIIDSSAQVDPTAKLGPGVYIAAGARIGPGVRIVNSIILDNVHVKANAFIKYAIIGWNSVYV